MFRSLRQIFNVDLAGIRFGDICKSISGKLGGALAVRSTIMNNLDKNGSLSTRVFTWFLIRGTQASNPVLSSASSTIVPNCITRSPKKIASRKLCCSISITCSCYKNSYNHSYKLSLHLILNDKSAYILLYMLNLFTLEIILV